MSDHDFLALSLEEFLDRLASGEATPGGGSAAALTGAVGYALVSMVARLSLSKKQYKEYETEFQAILDQAEVARQRLGRLVDDDAQAYAGVRRGFALPKGTPEEKEIRQQAIQEALKRAAEVPLEVARLATGLFPLAEALIQRGAASARTDAQVAFKSGLAAARGALWNVEVNLDSIKDFDYCQTMRSVAIDLDSQVRRAAERLAQLTKVE
ncbi:MAG: cyclodeaminase/cyclohydrolase family protein [Bacillota bacterium]